jgi:hypothetical protein
MSLSTLMAADVDNVLLNTDEFAVTVTYSRGASSVTITAVVQASVFEVSNEFGVTRIESRDYVIKPSSLNFGSGVTVPIRGDLITEGGNVYIVTAPDGAPVYGYDNFQRLLLKVHTTMKTGS